MIIKYLESLYREIFCYRECRIANLDYEEYWGFRKKYGKKNIKKRDLIISGLIKTDSTLLDVGCGNGRLLEYLRKEKGVIGLGLDNSKTALEIARLREVKTIKGDITSFNFSRLKAFDYVIVAEVIEHLPNPELLIKKILPNFKVSLIVSIPNISYWPYRIRLMFGKFPECWKWHPGEHLRFWTKSDFEHWIYSNFPSLKITKCYPVEIPEPLSSFGSLLSKSFVFEIRK